MAITKRHKNSNTFGVQKYYLLNKSNDFQYIHDMRYAYLYVKSLKGASESRFLNCILKKFVFDCLYLWYGL